MKTNATHPLTRDGIAAADAAATAGRRVLRDARTVAYDAWKAVWQADRTDPRCAALLAAFRTADEACVAAIPTLAR